MPKYRNKIQEYKAIRFTRENWEEVKKFTNGKAELVTERNFSGNCYIRFPNTNYFFAKEGDWIVKNSTGDCYPCKANIFQHTYELLP
jgi:hypothetical protein